MMKIRSLAVAFILCNNKVLMMHRHENRKIAGGLYAPVGGHMETGEMNHPNLTIVREIQEETGLDVQVDHFQYMVLRKKQDEIRIQYVYFIKTQSDQVVSNHEGTLEWLTKETLMEKPMTFTSKEILKQFFKEIPTDVLIGVCNDEPVMQWSVIEDWQNSTIK